MSEDRYLCVQILAPTNLCELISHSISDLRQAGREAGLSVDWEGTGGWGNCVSLSSPPPACRTCHIKHKGSSSPVPMQACRKRLNLAKAILGSKSSRWDFQNCVPPSPRHAPTVKRSLVGSVLTSNHIDLRNKNSGFQVGSQCLYLLYPLGETFDDAIEACYPLAPVWAGWESSLFSASQFSLGSHALIFGITRPEGRLKDIQGLARLQIPTPLWTW